MVNTVCYISGVAFRQIIDYKFGRRTGIEINQVVFSIMPAAFGQSVFFRYLQVVFGLHIFFRGCVEIKTGGTAVNLA